MNRPRLFVSAVTSELRGARRLVANTLRTLGFDPVIKDDFRTGFGELKVWLQQQIEGCEGVFQLVGRAYGAEPPVSADPGHPWPDPEFGRCSYTQFELLYARRLGKRTWVIEVGPAAGTTANRTNSTYRRCMTANPPTRTPAPTRPSAAPCNSPMSSACAPTTTCAITPTAMPSSKTACSG